MVSYLSNLDNAFIVFVGGAAMFAVWFTYSLAKFGQNASWPPLGVMVLFLAVFLPTVTLRHIPGENPLLMLAWSLFVMVIATIIARRRARLHVYTYDDTRDIQLIRRKV